LQPGISGDCLLAHIAPVFLVGRAESNRSGRAADPGRVAFRLLKWDDLAVVLALARYAIRITELQVSPQSGDLRFSRSGPARRGL